MYEIEDFKLIYIYIYVSLFKQKKGLLPDIIQ